MTKTIVEQNLRKQLKKTLTRPKFETWLKSKSPRTSVGEARAPDSCPIFKFLKQQNVPVRGVTNSFVRLTKPVSEGYTSGDPTIDVVNIPKWVSKFVTNIDESTKYLVSAKAALEILAKI